MIDVLYQDHLAILQQRAAHLLEQHQLDAVLIHSGSTKNYFLDDYAPVFKPNPHFVHWMPFLREQPECWLLIQPASKPILFIYSPDDFWHMTASEPSDFWNQLFDIHLYTDRAAQLKQFNIAGNVALIAENPVELPQLSVKHNPEALMHALHFQRAEKTPWEQHCIRQANRIAIKGHRFTQQGFFDGLSEFELHQGYLAATAQLEKELPYSNIVGLNEHAAVLHYQHKDRTAPEQHRALLVDAGAVCHGYVADITRTVSQGHQDFDAILVAMDQAQQALTESIKPGVSFLALHQQMHQKLFSILSTAGIVKSDAGLDPSDKVAITRTFYPHGLGHLLGIQVHDIGGWQQNIKGSMSAPPEQHPFLRLTRLLTEQMVVTIEPGLYFIPLLLEQLKSTPLARHINWPLVNELTPWGGIRIEDNVCVTATGAENYTRDAFNDPIIAL
ncbi:Xaa-Pro dipeptidase [uncultured Amphritea sp.]|uniref:Xaa-Pro dipeptidase n=1 Tax=uncultured Amphritea sp. TaxID=981605 RepID=UPI002624F875|nr:Xaa-Pro dipeptidase [uncultured Amphritea sp.]